MTFITKKHMSRRTILRGRTIFVNDQVTAGPGTGRFVRPGRT